MDRCRPARRPVGHRNHRETNRETDWEWPVGQEMGWGGRAGARIKFRLVDLEHTGSRRSEGGVVIEELLKRPRPVGRPAEEPGDLVEVQGARGPAGRVEEGRGPVGRGAGAGQAEVGGVLRARWSSRIGGGSIEAVGQRSQLVTGRVSRGGCGLGWHHRVQTEAGSVGRFVRAVTGRSLASQLVTGQGRRGGRSQLVQPGPVARQAAGRPGPVGHRPVEIGGGRGLGGS